jgi:hypothetical protein
MLAYLYTCKYRKGNVETWSNLKPVKACRDAEINKEGEVG